MAEGKSGNRAQRARATLGDIAEVRPGFAMRTGAIYGDLAAFKVVQGRDVGDDGHVGWPLLRACQPTGDVERFLIRDGDVLLTTRTTALRAAVAIDPPANVIASAQFALLRPDPTRIDAGYLAWLLNRADTRRRLGALLKGSTIPFLPVADLRWFEIQVPPLTRQRLIAHIARLRRRESELRAQLERARDVLIDALNRRTPISK